MATAATNTKVTQLRADAQAKADEAARFFEGLTAEQAATKTEIGWTVAATAAHLASSAGFTAMQLKQLKQGKVTRVPNSVVDLTNFLSARSAKKKPIAESVTTLKANTQKDLALLDDWTDADLEKQFDKPYFGANTYEEALRYSFVGHFDEHVGQVKRALEQ
jgi:uncharacterized damage-inducible protein DinB